MLVSTKGRYALRVMIDIARQETDEYIILMDVARRQNISEKYLESIIASLSKAGFLLAQRGRGGGYRMAKPPEECSVGAILRAAEGYLAPVACLKTGEADCPNADDCITLPLWMELDRRIDKFLDSVSLRNLMDGDIPEDE